MKGLLKTLTALSLVVLMTVLASAINLEDVKDIPDDWSTDAMKWSVTEALLDDENGYIYPESQLLRAELADIMVRYAGEGEEGIDLLPLYTDIDKDAWYYDSLCKAYEMGIIEGYANLMRPLDRITREEAFTILGRALGLADESKDIPEMAKFGDVDAISDWAVGKVAALVKAGYVLGDGANIIPGDFITRKEFIMIIYRMAEKPIEPDLPDEVAPDGGRIVPSDLTSDYYYFVINSETDTETGAEFRQYSSGGEGDIDLNIYASVPDSTPLSQLSLEISTKDGSGKRVSYFGMTIKDGVKYTGQELFNQLAVIAEYWSNYVRINIPIVNINKTDATVGDLRELYKLVNHVYQLTEETHRSIWENDLGITMHSDTYATVLYNVYDFTGRVIYSGASISLNVAS